MNICNLRKRWGRISVILFITIFAPCLAHAAIIYNFKDSTGQVAVNLQINQIQYYYNNKILLH